MQKALDMAKKAYESDEIPIGALLVKDDIVVNQEHNRTKEFNDPLAHAEKLILDKAPEKYLYDYTLYITLEPCLMCAGMIIWRRVGRIVFAAYDKKAGAVGSVYNALLDRHFNHNPKVTAGLFAKESQELLISFFKNKR
jgi:tRNA(adenine34) deaminase